MIVAFAPELVLYSLATLTGTGGSTTAKVTVASAFTLVIGSVVLYGWHLFAAWLFSIRTSMHRLADWGFRRPGKAIFWTVPVALFAVYVVSIAHDTLVHPKQQAIVGDFPHGAAGTVLFALLAVVVAPLAEETFFRGFLFRGFSNSWGWVVGAIVSAAIFGAAHLQLTVFVPLFALGFALAWVYKRTGSLWASIALHAIFNAISVIAWALTG
jgi:membrane protease YdiL (CAAX protease family)